MNISHIVAKAKGLVSSHPDQVRQGLDKVERTIDAKTRGKYSGALSKGRGRLDQALGVTRRGGGTYGPDAGGPGRRTEPRVTDRFTAPWPQDSSTGSDEAARRRESDRRE